MKLKQIKEFTVETVTEDFAAELCSLVAWSHLNEQRYKNQHPFTIVAGEPKGVLKTGGGECYPWKPERANLYNKVETGVEIEISITRQRARLWEDGRVHCYYKKESPSDWEYFSRHIPTGEERQLDNLNYPANPVELVQLYIDWGFFTYE